MHIAYKFNGKSPDHMKFNIGRYAFSLVALMLLSMGWSFAEDGKSPFSIDVELEQSINADWNFDLNEEKEDGVAKFETAIELAVEYEMNKDILAYLKFESGRELEIEEKDSERNYESTLDLDEGYVEFKDIFSNADLTKKTSMTLGRFNLSDKREWYYDENLDGVLLSFQLKPIDTEFTLSVNREELIGSNLLRHNDTDTVNNYIMVAEHEPSKTIDIKFSAYSIIRDDRSQDNESPRIFGLGTSGKLANDKIRFWSDFAWARGNDDDEKIKGVGLDVGVTMSTSTGLGPYITLAYAYGSGDGDADTDFRQTGLQGNSARFGGVTSFKYYGEVLDPELSNLHILTAGLGFRISPTASIDLIYHHYRQDEALDELRSSDIDEDPSGDDQDIGSEFDVVLGARFSSNIETEWVLGYFQPGAAFDDDNDDAYMVEAKITYEF